MIDFEDLITMDLVKKIHEYELISSDNLREEIHPMPTRKQYYTRMAKLMARHIIKKERGLYSMTSYGKTLLYAINIMKTAEDNRWKLEAVDRAPKEIKSQLFRELIDKQSLLGRIWIR